jgi:hypothetical protein
MHKKNSTRNANDLFAGNGKLTRPGGFNTSTNSLFLFGNVLQSHVLNL